MGFGLTSGVITTLGLMVGLNSGTHSKIVVLGSILVIAVADSLSDALGIHMSEESDHSKSHGEAWQSTIFTFLFKFLFSLTFAVPVLLLSLSTAVVVSVLWGFVLIVFFSIYVARQQKRPPLESVLEHLGIAILVVVATHFIGEWVATLGQ